MPQGLPGVSLEWFLPRKDQEMKPKLISLDTAKQNGNWREISTNENSYATPIHQLSRRSCYLLGSRCSRMT